MSTALYFALCGNPEVSHRTFSEWDWTNRPLNLLVAYPFIKQWREKQFTPTGVRTILDSGAYSAWKSGHPVVIDELIKEARQPDWHEVVALDVIGDADGSVKNTEYMRAQGLTVMPVFHYGDPWEHLKFYCERYHRVGLSCRFGEPLDKSFRWLEQCFSRTYPARFHSFGWVSRTMLLKFPFFSADTASWHTPVRFGRSNAKPWMPHPRKSQVGADSYNLTREIEHYLQLEEEVQDRWRKELVWSQSPPSVSPAPSSAG